MPGALVNVRVQPRSKRNAVELLDDGTLKVFVTAPPESGRANAAVVAMLSKTLKVPKSSIEIVRGQASRDKIVRFDLLGMAEIRDRIAQG